MARSTVTISFSIDPEEYGDVVRWLDSIERGRKSSAICTALRAHLRRSGVTVGDVYQAVKALERKLQAGAFVAGTAGSDDAEWDEPPEAAAALDALAEL